MPAAVSEPARARAPAIGVVQRLKTRAQFQAVLAAGATVARTAHFALHRRTLDASVVALFPCPGVWLGAMLPKRWAKRAVTRNAIRRQVYAISAGGVMALPSAAYVVRLRSSFDRQRFASASSPALKTAVREELVELLARAAPTP